MDNYIEIKGIMDQYIALMDKLIAFEQEKLTAVQSKNLEQLDIFLKDEQAYLLQLRGLDQKREKIQQELGLEGLTYREIIDKTSGSVKNDLESSFMMLSGKTEQFRGLIKTINTFVEIQLHTVDAAIERFGAVPPSKASENGIYGRISNQELASTGVHKFRSTKV